MKLLVDIRNRVLVRLLPLSIIIILLTHGFVQAADINGIARVVDGDTVWIGETKIRLHGIDAPEMKQACRTKQGKEQRCGAQSKQALHAMVQGQQGEHLAD